MPHLIYINISELCVKRKQDKYNNIYFKS
jgi:hypothetical protein